MTNPRSMSGFHRLSLAERRERVAALRALSDADLEALAPARGLSEQHALQMVENAVGILGMPLGVAVNLRLDGADVVVPMAIEEPSVIAACSYASKLLASGGGVTTTASPPHMVGQIQVLDVPDAAAAERALLSATPELLALANAGHASLVGAGGGAIALEVRHLSAAPGDTADPCGPMLVVHLVVDVRDAMGANAINSMCERLAPRVASLSGGRVGLRILTNLSDRRLVSVEGRVPFSALAGQGMDDPAALARAIEEASVFAERDPYRACTHNKGIMNGVDAVLLALGQDFRAVEAGAHAYAAQGGRYTALARWRVEADALVGRLTLPMAVGTVGGIVRVHPVVKVTRKIAGVDRADELGKMAAAIGLAQNLAAIRALAAEGIQRGHMRMHARNVAAEAGAAGDEIEIVAAEIARRGEINVRAAAAALAEQRGATAPEAGARPARGKKRPFAPETRRAPVSDVAPAPRAHATAAVAGGGRLPSEPPLGPLDRAFGERAMQERTFGGRVLVTGAAGHLGANLVHRLAADGHDVRAMLRQGRNNDAVDGLDVERVFADLRDLEATRRAVRGCQTVYHVAARLAGLGTGAAEERALREHNVLGTRNLLLAAREAGVERVVLTSSTVAGGDARASERAPAGALEGERAYAHTKVLAELEALRAMAEGLDVVIASTGALLGPHDHKPSQTGRMLLDFANGALRAYVPGLVELAAARDAVEGHLLAMRRGRTGQRYAFATARVTLDELMGLFEEVSGRPRPRLRIGASVVRTAERFVSPILRRVSTGAPPRLGRVVGVASSLAVPAELEKARVELGFEPTTLRRAVHEAYADFARRGLVPARRAVLGAPSADADGRRPRSAPPDERTAAAG